MKIKSKIQHSNMTGTKRKMELDSEAKITKVINPSKKNKVPLKAALITELKVHSFGRKV